MDEPPAPPRSGASSLPSSPASTTPASRWGVLRHRHFRVFWFAAFFSFLGNWFEFVGTQWIVAQATGSTMWLSWIGAAQLLPTLILGLMGGIVADRVNRKRLLIGTQVVMMVIAIGFALAVYFKHANPWTLLVLALAQGVAVAFNTPAWQVLLPRLVPRDELVKGITLQGISFNVARAVGPAIAGVIMGFYGPTSLFLLNAVSFIGVMLAVMTTPDAPAPEREGSLWDLADAKRDTVEAFNFVWGERGPRAALIAMVVFALLATPVLRFLPLFVSEVYHKEAKTFGLITGIMGVGAVVGGLLLKFVPLWYPKHHFIPLSVFLGGLWIFIYALTPDPILAAVFMFFVGIFWMWAFNSSMAAMQVLVHDSMRGRAMAVCNTAAMGLMPIGSFIASFVGESAAKGIHRWHPELWDEGLATQIGVAFVALVLTASGVVMLIWRTPEVDGLKPGDPGYDRTPGFWRGITASLHRPRPQTACPRCLYELGVTPGEDEARRCPECGETFARADAAERTA